MAMKKQASLLSFFTRSPNPKNALQDESIGNQTTSSTPPKVSKMQKNINGDNDIRMEDVTKSA
ncbi:unnamed protein product [Brugia timori]|uniref:DNA-binding protein n=1 Tax=Brugia timori TaxID=42155 RepID=A0A0R3Q6C0_9BILA|nr:unnamed protein product [Brugia timori]